MATAQQITQVTQLFTALFMRAPAVSGLTFYTDQLAAGTSLADVAQQMYDTTPARTYYPTGATNDAVVTSFFTNTLGRAPLTGGLTYWSDQLTTKTHGQVIADMIQSVVAWAPTGDATADAEGTVSQNLFNNKVTVGEYFAVTLAGTDATLAANAYAGVTDDVATVTTANAANAAAIAAAAPTTYTLTASTASVMEGEVVTYTVTASKAVTADTVVSFTVTPGDSLAADQGTGTTNLNDFAAGSFNPTSVTIAAGSTTATFDVSATNDGKTELPESFTITAVVDGTTTLTSTGSLLDGASKTTTALTSSVDTITSSTGSLLVNGVIVKDHGTGTTAQPGDSVTGGSSTSDEVAIQISGTHGSGQTLSAFQTTGVERLTVSNFETSANDDTIDAGLMTGLTTVGLSSSSATGDTIFSGLKNIVGAEMKNGAGDLTLTYGTSVATGTADTQALAVSNLTGGIFNAAKVEAVTIASSLLKSTLTAVTATAMETLTVTGDKDLTITNALDFAGTGTIAGTLDASAFTGKLSVVLSTAEDTDVKGGTGDDTFNYVTALTAEDILDGGAGTDTISVQQNTFTLADYKITNTEVIKAEAVNTNDLSVVTGASTAITTVKMVENATTAKALSVADLAAGVAVEIINSVDAQKVGAVTVNLKDASGSADAVTISLLGTQGHLAADNTLDSLTTANIETVNLVSSHDGSTALDAADTNTVTSLAISNATTLNASGSDPLAVTVATSTTLTTADASAMTDNVTLTLSNVTAATTAKAGSGNDTIDFGAKLNNADTVDGGANTGTSGKDTLIADVTGLTATTGALNVANVEMLQLTNTGTAVIDATAITGASEIGFSGAATATTVQGLANGANVGLGLYDTVSMQGTVTVKLADETGTADSVNVAINKVTTATLKATAIETVNINVANASTNTGNDNTTLTVTALNAATVNVTGSKYTTTHTLGLGTLDTETTTLDASTYYGTLTAVGATDVAVTASVKGGTNAHVITTSTKNDTVSIVGDASTGVYDLSASTGTDVLNATLSSAATDFTSVDGFETINLTIKDSTAAGFNDGTKDDGLNLATTVNVLGGNSLSSFVVGTAGVIDVKAAATVIDASTFAGAIDLTTASDGFNAFLTIKGGAITSDKVTTTIAGAMVPKAMTGVETLVVKSTNADTAASIDLAAVTGLTKVQASFTTAAAADQIEIKSLADGVKVETDLTTTADNLVIGLTNKSNTNNTLDLKITAATNATDVLNLDILEVETLNINMAAAAYLDLAGVTATSTAKTALTFTGSSNATISASGSANGNIDASAMTGNLIVSSRANTSAIDIKGGAGADTFIMANAADTIDAGAGSDTLSVSYTSVLGGTQVDLSSTTDQIATFNGASNAAVQLGFTNANLSGYAGNGAEIIAHKDGSTIVGTSSTDLITGGAGVDIITGGAGNDTISGGAGADQFRMATDSGKDTISDFTDGTDFLAFLDGAATGAVAFANTVGTAAGVVMNAADVKAAAAGATATDGTGFTANASITMSNVSMTSAQIQALDLVATATTAYLVVHNSDTGVAEVWYDAAWGTAGGEVQIATISSITTLAGVQALTSADFYAFA